MACEKGIPYNGKCYSPADFQKVLNESIGVVKNQGSTSSKNSAAATTTDKKDEKKGFDWLGVLSVVLGAAPAVIAATKGGSNTTYDPAYDPAYNRRNSTNEEPDTSSTPIWIWGVIGLVVAIVFYLLLRPKS